jgi:hypothetical protein
MTQSQPWFQPLILAEPARGWDSFHTELKSLAAGFSPISLEQMDAVALLNRVDTKFVMPAHALWEALENLQQDYWMLSVNGQRLNRYRTLYFDTPNFELYQAHVNGRAERYKVRSREYADSHLSFLEVKHKTRKDRTIKQRIPTAELAVRMTPDLKQWLRGVFPLDNSSLEPKLWNNFIRMTLVSKACCERVTLDVNLSFFTADRMVRLDGLVVAEIKMDSEHQASPFFSQMRAQRIRQRSFSKYSIGASMLYEQVKKNALKPSLLGIKKMMKGLVNDERSW